MWLVVTVRAPVRAVATRRLRARFSSNAESFELSRVRSFESSSAAGLDAFATRPELRCIRLITSCLSLLL